MAPHTQMKSGLLLNVVVGQCPTILQLLPSKDQTLLVRGDTLLVLDLRLHIINCVRRLHLQSDGLPREGLDEYLHTATESEHKVKSRLLLNVVVRQGAPVLELLAGKDETLLVGGNTTTRMSSIAV
jgi:hypothetical protein